MTDRIQLTRPVYMPLQGQWQIVDIGSVIDVASAGKFSSAHITVLAETAGPLVNSQHTPVRNIRTR
jgi:hypothetical protein